VTLPRESRDSVPNPTSLFLIMEKSRHTSGGVELDALGSRKISLKMDEYISNGLAPGTLRWSFNQLAFGQITHISDLSNQHLVSHENSSQALFDMASFPQFTTFPAEIQALVMTQCLPNDLICLRLTW
jgi:hypothetical protein